MAGHLVRGEAKRVYGDPGYTGMGKTLDEDKDDPVSRCCIAAKRGAIKNLKDNAMKTRLLAIERVKASIRAKVEHPFHVINVLF